VGDRRSDTLSDDDTALIARLLYAKLGQRDPGEKWCAHLRTVPVTLTLTGELVAELCLDCDQQLPANAAAHTWPGGMF
jgi:hypothetical protein